MTNHLQPHVPVTYDALSKRLGIPRHRVEREERKAITKIIDEILKDPRIIDVYGGCLVSVAKAIMSELGIPMKVFVRCVNKHTVKQHWTI